MQALFKKKGVYPVLETLSTFTGPVLEKTFLREFQRLGKYSAYDRCRAVLLEQDLIAFTSEGENKLIALTSKGLEILQLMQQIDAILGNKKEQ